jgi:hypothetical protein
MLNPADTETAILRKLTKATLDVTERPAFTTFCLLVPRTSTLGKSLVNSPPQCMRSRTMSKSLVDRPAVQHTDFDDSSEF